MHAGLMRGKVITCVFTKLAWVIVCMHMHELTDNIERNPPSNDEVTRCWFVSR